MGEERRPRKVCNDERFFVQDVQCKTTVKIVFPPYIKDKGAFCFRRNVLYPLSAIGRF